MRKKEEKKVISVNLFKKRKEESLFSNEWAIKVTMLRFRLRPKFLVGETKIGETKIQK